MKRLDLLRTLHHLDRLGIYVLTRRDLDKAFPDETTKAMDQSLARMVNEGLLQRVARGLYVNPAAVSKNRWVAEEIAKALRPGELSYVSLETILSEYGLISQVPVNRLTVMTRGSSGIVETPYGTVEFTHTKRRAADVLLRTEFVPGRPLRFATKDAAVRDLRRVGRNLNMLVTSEPDDDDEQDTE